MAEFMDQLDTIADLHECDMSLKVHSLTFETMGFATYACSTCAPMIETAARRRFGADHVIITHPAGPCDEHHPRHVAADQ